MREGHVGRRGWKRERGEDGKRKDVKGVRGGGKMGIREEEVDEGQGKG